ncbi:MAG: hypothetical protein R3B47_05275 [Bacteroidia bacterium]
MAGNLAMVHRVFMGMQFETDGLKAAPVVPEAYSGTKRFPISAIARPSSASP